MANESWKRDVGFEKQMVAFETIATGVHASKQFMRFFGTDDVWMTPEIIDLTGTESSRDPVEYAAGVYAIRGRRIPDIEVVPDKLATLLECLMGVASGANPNVFTLADTLPYFTIWKRVGDVYMGVVGTKIQSAEFAFGAGPLKVSLEIRARHTQAMTAQTFPEIVHSNKKPFMFHHLTVTYGGPSLDVKDASLSVVNGLPDDDFYSGSRYTHEHTEGVRAITGRLRATFTSYDQLTTFIASTEKALSFSIQSPHGDTLLIEVPRIVHTPDVGIAESENLWRIDLPFTAFKLDNYDLITMTLTTV